MNTQKNNNDNFTVNAKTAVIFAICVAGLLFVARFDAIKGVFSWIASMLMPIFVGTMTAYILNPLTVFFESRSMKLFKKLKENPRKRLSRAISIIMSLVVLIAVVALLLFLIIPEFIQSLNKLIDMAPGLFENVLSIINDAKNSDNIFMVNLSQAIDDLVGKLGEWLESKLSVAVNGIIDIGITFVNFIFDMIVAVVVFVYAILEKDSFLAQSKKLLFAVFPKNIANDVLAIARYGNETFGKFITGKLVTSTIVGVLTFTFMSIMGMPYPLLAAGILCITNVIPFFGPFIGGIPTAFIVAITDFRQGVIYIIFMLVLQQIEGNVIEPMVMEDRTGVSKFWIIFAILFCGGVFGLAGMIFSVPIFAVLFYTIKMYVERSLAKKSLPVPSSSYRNAGGIDEENNIMPIPEHSPRKRFGQAIREWISRLKNGTDKIDETEE